MIQKSSQYARKLFSTGALPEIPATTVKRLFEKVTVDYKKALELRKSNLNPAIFNYYKEPLYITEGKMQYLILICFNLFLINAANRFY